MSLLQMDYNLLGYLVEHGGAAPFDGIPAKLFCGTIPESAPDLYASGLITSEDGMIIISDAGRATITQENR